MALLQHWLTPTAIARMSSSRLDTLQLETVVAGQFCRVSRAFPIHKRSTTFVVIRRPLSPICHLRSFAACLIVTGRRIVDEASTALRLVV